MSRLTLSKLAASRLKQAHVSSKEQWAWGVSLLGGAMSWLFHLMTAYAIGEFACIAGAPNLAFWGLVATTLAALAIGTLSLAIALRVPNDFIASFGSLANGFFLFVILAQSAPIILLMEGC